MVCIVGIYVHTDVNGEEGWCIFLKCTNYYRDNEYFSDKLVGPISKKYVQ